LKAVRRFGPRSRRFRILPNGVEVRGEVVVAARCVGVLLPERDTADFQGIAAKGLGLGILPLCVKDVCDIVITYGGVRMGISERLSAYLERFAEETFGVSVLF